MNKERKSRIQKMITILLSCALIMGALPLPQYAVTARAEELATAGGVEEAQPAGVAEEPAAGIVEEAQTAGKSGEEPASGVAEEAQTAGVQEEPVAGVVEEVQTAGVAEEPAGIIEEAQPASVAEEPAGGTEDELSGSGTEEDPYLIGSTKDWETFAKWINAGTNADKHYLLTADISSVSAMAGQKGKPFKGIFDGDGHTMELAICDTENQGAAPFRYISDATIQFVRTTGTVSGNLHCAGLAGFTWSGGNVIQSCIVEARIDCIGGAHSHCGGILGHGEQATNTIKNCLFAGTVSGPTTATGVIYGWGDWGGSHYIENCLEDGTYIDASNISMVTCDGTSPVCRNCYKRNESINYGTYVPKTGDDSKTPEELASLLGEGWKTENDRVIPILPSRNISDAEIFDLNDIYYYTGSDIALGYRVKEYGGRELQEGVDYKVEITDRNGNIVDSVKERGFYTLTVKGLDPYFNSISGSFIVLNNLEGEGTRGAPYLIGSIEDWETFSVWIENEKEKRDKHYKLTADLSGVSIMIGTQAYPFEGCFDGDGHTLDLAICDTENQGAAPFHYIDGATIQYIRTTGTVSGNLHCAGLAGFALNGPNIIRSSIVEARIDCIGGAHSHCGGILGHAKSGATTIEDCLFSGVISGASQQTGVFFGWYDNTSYYHLLLRNCLEDGTYINASGISLSPRWQNLQIINCYRKSDEVNKGTYIPEGTMSPEELVLALGSRWKVQDGKAVPVLTPRDVVGAKINGLRKSYGYTGSDIGLSYRVRTIDGKDLKEGMDYRAEITDGNGNPIETVREKGIYTLTVTGLEPCFDSTSRVFVVADPEAEGSLDGEGTEDSPFLIGSVRDWEIFAGWINSGINTDKCYQLTADISGISAMAGTEENPFEGIFDGDGHTLGVDILDPEIEGVAPFRYISDAVIQYVKTTGTVSGGNYCSGLVGFATGDTNSICSCAVETAIYGIKRKYGYFDGNQTCCGGILGNGKQSATTINNCLFRGMINGPDRGADICGWGEFSGTLIVENCLGIGSFENTWRWLLYNEREDYSVENSYHNGGNYYPATGHYFSSDEKDKDRYYYMSPEAVASALGVAWKLEGAEVLPILTSKDMSLAQITGLKNYYHYNSSAVQADYTVKTFYGRKLVEDRDYRACITDGSGQRVDRITKKGIYILTVTALEPYFNSTSMVFEVGDLYGLGTGIIGAPVSPNAAGDTPGWTGSYVYYGKYDGKTPTKYRMLDKASHDFGISCGSMLLDCDSALFSAPFSDDIFNHTNQWKACTLRVLLNGEGFLDKPGNFTKAEKESIAVSEKYHRASADGTGDGFGTFGTMSSDRIFVLDPAEVTRTSYGYGPAKENDTFIEDENKKKQGIEVEGWWLRSYGNNGAVPFVTKEDGKIKNNWKGCFATNDVSPAFNVSLPSVVFSSLIRSCGKNTGEPGAEYKLTLLDQDMTLSVSGDNGIMKAGDAYRIPYAIVVSANHPAASHVSIVVTGGSWTENGWSEGAELLQCETEAIQGLTGAVSFKPGEEITGKWGTDYHVYLLPVIQNGEKETDYAGAPQEIVINTEPPEVSASGFAGRYDGQPHGITVKVTKPGSGAQVRYGTTEDIYNLEESPAITDVKDSPLTVYYRVSAAGYMTVVGSETVTISRASISPTVTIDNWTYGDAQSTPSVNGNIGNGKVTYLCTASDGTVLPFPQAISLNAGTYELAAYIEAAGNTDGGEARTTFTVGQRSITVSGITAFNKEYDGTKDAILDCSKAVFDGAVSGDELAITAQGVFLDENAEKGKKVKISGWTLSGSASGNYVLAGSGNQDETAADITPASIKDAEVALEQTRIEYTGEVLSVKVSGVTLNGKALKENADYVISGNASGTNRGNYTVTVEGIGNYKDSASAVWAITDTLMTISAPDVSKTWDGKPLGITVTVTDPAEGYTIRYGRSEDSCTLEESPVITDVGTLKVYYRVTAANYETESGSATVTILEAESTVSAPSAKEGLEYNGKAQELVDKGFAEGGTLKYAVTKAGAPAPKTADYTEEIPTAINAGSYTVYYLVEGYPNHKSIPVQSISVTIAKAVFEKTGLSVNQLSGSAGMIDLSDYICDGGTAGSLTFSDPDHVLSDKPVMSGGFLSLSLAEASDNEGKQVTVQIKITSENYEEYLLQVTVTVVAQCVHTKKELRRVQAATCMKEGYTGDLCCMDCNAMLKKGEVTPVNPENHDYDYAKGVVAKAATYLSYGSHIYTCRHNSAHTLTLKDIEPLPSPDGRDYLDFAKDTMGLSENIAVNLNTVVDPKTGEVSETVTVGETEISKIITDPESGRETVETMLWIGGMKESYRYTGNAIKPEIHVYDGVRKLTEKTDYSLSYKDNKNVGDGSVTVKFKGNYSNNPSRTVVFRIDQAVLGEDVAAQAMGVVEKRNKAVQQPKPKLIWKETGKEVSSKLFDVTYDKDVTEVGTYRATVRPKDKNGNFTGETETVITVVSDKDKNLLLNNTKVAFKDEKGKKVSSYPYGGGAAVIPKAELTLNGKQVDADCYEMTLMNNIYPGTAVATFTAISGNKAGLAGSKTATFRIKGTRELKDEGSGSPFTYTLGSEGVVPYAKGGAKIAVTVKDGGQVLTEGKDYTLSFKKNKSVTTQAEVKVRGKGSYKGTVTLKYAVKKQALSLLKVGAADQFVAKGSPKLKNPKVKVTDLDGKKLSLNKDYKIKAVGDPEGDDLAGTVSFVLEGLAGYEGDATASFRYVSTPSANIASAKAGKIPQQEYTGNPIALSGNDLKEAVYTGKASQKTFLTYGTDFRVAGYANNTRKGTGKVTVEGIGSMAGTKTLSFKILSRDVPYKGALIGGDWDTDK
ncbi:MAG: DUF6273 domain-containing protein [Lachnospiraceae bacterium]|nr:DUF6273 domain-containing protein [Lachnospiraceae bacterium]